MKSQGEIAQEVADEIASMSDEQLKDAIENLPEDALNFGRSIMMMDPTYYGQATGVNDELEEDHF